jgi:hypothetical protein
MERAYIARAFDSVLRATIARLRLHYGMRLAAVDVLSGPTRAAAIAALLREQDVALACAIAEIVGNRRETMRRARQKRQRRRYHGTTPRLLPLASTRHGTAAAVRPGQPMRGVAAKDHRP